MAKLTKEALEHFKKLMSEKYTVEASDEYQRKHGVRSLAWTLRERARKETQKKGCGCWLWFWQKKR